MLLFLTEEATYNLCFLQRKKQIKKGDSQACTAGEAIANMMKRKKISLHLNYDALKNLDQGPSVTESTAGNRNAEDSQDPFTSSIFMKNVKRRIIRPKAPSKIPFNIKNRISDLIGISK